MIRIDFIGDLLRCLRIKQVDLDMDQLFAALFRGAARQGNDRVIHFGQPFTQVSPNAFAAACNDCCIIGHDITIAKTRSGLPVPPLILSGGAMSKAPVAGKRSRLRRHCSPNLPAYTPGAHIDVHCGEGIIRQYSLCGDPADRRRLTIAVRQVDLSRGGSDLMHRIVEKGDRLEIGAPRNNFPLDETAAHCVLLAAGIGITPIIAMADRLRALGRSFALHYFSRAPEHTAFRARLTQGDCADKVTFHEGLDVQGTGDTLDDILSKPISGGQVYMCGPGPFMDCAETAAGGHWPADAINLERFAAKPALAGAPTRPFLIELARRGVTLEVGPHETILDVLNANEIDAAFSCEQGVCGTCVTDVLSGTPEHRDSFLSPKQRSDGKTMCICGSRAKESKLVLDL